ncbi:MAG: hypothetical protein AB7K24_14885 [Gemmataceae bacterium]
MEHATFNAFEKVVDRVTFLDFVATLLADRRDAMEKERLNPSSPYGPDANGWENTTIDRFLEAALAWARAEVTQRKVFCEEPGWKAFANFLMAGKSYE